MEPVKVEVEGTIKHESSNPVKIEVTRGQKGNYGWTISVSGSNHIGILNQVKELDTQLKADFPQPEGG